MRKVRWGELRNKEPRISVRKRTASFAGGQGQEAGVPKLLINQLRTWFRFCKGQGWRMGKNVPRGTKFERSFFPDMGMKHRRRCWGSPALMKVLRIKVFQELAVLKNR